MAFIFYGVSKQKNLLFSFEKLVSCVVILVEKEMLGPWIE
jgi:hypothetical protein